MLKSLSPKEVEEMLRNGAVLCDIRGPREFAREHIKGARNVSLPAVTNVSSATAHPLIFCCLSGARTTMAAGHLAEAAGRPAYVLEGGLSAWKGVGLPVANG
jgi:rhodanese-related sulfurtransferase